MAKGSRGGKRGASGGMAVPPTTVTPPTPQDIANGNVLPKGGVPFSKFQSMTDDEKADVVLAALGVGTPMFLDDSGLQKFAYFTGMSDKPTIVSDSQLDQMKGKNLYRTVNDAYNRNTDIGYTSTDIINQITKGDFTMYSDSGGSAHGKGIYFADDYRDSRMYGNGKNTKMMRAKVTGGKSISESQLNTDYNNALRSGDKLAQACSKADRQSARNLYGLAKGYSTVNCGYGYYVVLNRGALTVSSKTKNPMNSSSW